ncbi:MAG TPA: hypothetical protein DCX54_10895 [Flavobacteriales bacterium]|nr:hypothetical protein [Flavobacteriales bacterium]
MRRQFTQILRADLDLYIELLQGKDCELKELAAWNLGLIGDERAVKFLVSSIVKRDPCCIEKATIALGRIGSGESIPALINLLLDYGLDVDWPYLRSYAALSLGRIKSEKAIPVLVKVLKDKSRSVRANAVKALGIVAGKSVKNHLLPLLDDEDNTVCMLTDKILSSC